MDTGEFIFGAAMIAGGVFVAVYGELLFKYVLSVIGFAVGFGAAYYILDDQDDIARVLLAAVAGGALAILFKFLLNFGLYIAGGILGGVAGLIIAGILGLGDEKWPTLIIALVGIGGVGFFGRRLGNMIIPLATAAAAALMVAFGFLAWFESSTNSDVQEPGDQLNRTAVLVLFAIIYAISFLAQWTISNQRQRIMNR